jgi:hypothetical protein
VAILAVEKGRSIEQPKPDLTSVADCPGLITFLNCPLSGFSLAKSSSHALMYPSSSNA